MGKAWIAGFEDKIAPFKDLMVVNSRVVNAYFAKKVVTSGIAGVAPTVDFEEINEGILGREVYVIVETQFMNSIIYTLGLEIPSITLEFFATAANLTAPTAPTGVLDQLISVTNGTANVSSFTTQVGNTDALNDADGQCIYSNLSDFSNMAIFKVAMRPHTRSDFDIWAQNIHTAGATPPKIQIQISMPDTNLAIAYGPENNPHQAPAKIGRFTDVLNEFTLENKTVYEIYHGDNAYNRLGNHTINNNQIQRRIGEMRNASTTDISYYYHDNNDNEWLVDELTRNAHGLVQFPDAGQGFGRYGGVDAGGIDNVVRPHPAQENVGQGDHYVMPLTAAALLGVTQEVNSRNWRVDFGDMSSDNGSDPWEAAYVTQRNRLGSRGHHAGHGHMGNRIGLDADLRYLDNLGNSFHGTIHSSVFNDANNEILFQIAFDYGFHSNYATTKHHYAGVNGNVLEHLDHGHWGLGNINAEIIL